MGNSKRGISDLEARARESQRKSEQHIGREFRCDVCGFPHQESEMKIQHGKRVCASCFEPGGDEIDRAERRAFSAKYAAQRDGSRRLPKYAFAMETAPWINSFMPSPAVLFKTDLNIPETTGAPVVLIVEGGKLGEITWTLPTGVTLVSNTVTPDGTYATLVLSATDAAVAGDYPILANGEYYREKIRVLESEMDYTGIYLRLDGTNNGPPELTWIDSVALNAAVAALVPTSRQINVSAPLTGGGNLGANVSLGINTFGAAQPGVVPLSGGGTTNFLRADGTWAVPAGAVSSFNSRTGAVAPLSGDYTVAMVTGAAPLASPTFTGVPAAPTAAVGTNTTQLATTAFVEASFPRSDAGAIVKGSVDATKFLRIEVDGFTASTTRVMTPPNEDFIVATANTVQTISGKKLFTAQYNASKYAATYAASQTVDFNNGNVQEITLTGNITTLTFSNAVSGGRYVLILKHSGGARTVAWNAAQKWSGGTVPTLSAAGKTDIISIFFDGTDYLSSAVLNF